MGRSEGWKRDWVRTGRSEGWEKLLKLCFICTRLPINVPFGKVMAASVEGEVPGSLRVECALQFGGDGIREIDIW